MESSERLLALLSGRSADYVPYGSVVVFVD